jgi:hypothetical protein
MVDVEKIQKLLGNHFEIKGRVTIDPITGVVDVDGNVGLQLLPKVASLPVSFGRVSGSFWCTNHDLNTLVGSPTEVGKNFWCEANFLRNLEGAPKSVGANFDCSNNQLTTLDGAPLSVGGNFEVDYSSLLPLLRLLQYNHIHVANAPKVVTQILNKYAGTGKRGMLGAGVELARAGFKANARW